MAASHSTGPRIDGGPLGALEGAQGFKYADPRAMQKLADEHNTSVHAWKQGRVEAVSWDEMAHMVLVLRCLHAAARLAVMDLDQQTMAPEVKARFREQTTDPFLRPVISRMVMEYGRPESTERKAAAKILQPNIPLFRVATDTTLTREQWVAYVKYMQAAHDVTVAYYLDPATVSAQVPEVPEPGTVTDEVYRAAQEARETKLREIQVQVRAQESMLRDALQKMEAEQPVLSSQSMKSRLANNQRAHSTKSLWHEAIMARAQKYVDTWEEDPLTYGYTMFAKVPTSADTHWADVDMLYVKVNRSADSHPLPKVVHVTPATMESTQQAAEEAARAALAAEAADGAGTTAASAEPAPVAAPSATPSATAAKPKSRTKGGRRTNAAGASQSLPGAGKAGKARASKAKDVPPASTTSGEAVSLSIASTEVAGPAGAAAAAPAPVPVDADADADADAAVSVTAASAVVDGVADAASTDATSAGADTETAAPAPEALSTPGEATIQTSVAAADAPAEPGSTAADNEVVEVADDTSATAAAGSTVVGPE